MEYGKDIFDDYQVRYWVRHATAGAVSLIFYDFRLLSEASPAKPILLELENGGVVGVDLGRHRPPSQHHNDSKSHIECDLLAEGSCLYSGSGLPAMGLVPTYREGNEEALYAVLNDFFRERGSRSTT